MVVVVVVVRSSSKPFELPHVPHVLAQPWRTTSFELQKGASSAHETKSYHGFSAPFWSSASVHGVQMVVNAFQLSERRHRDFSS